MRRLWLLLALAAAVAASAAHPQSIARRTAVLRRPAVVAAAPASTTLNPADKSSLIGLSGGNLTAAKLPTGGWNSARSIASASAAFIYAEATNVTAGVATGVGVCNAAMTLSDLVGNTADGLGWPSNDTNIISNGSNAGAGTSTWNTAGAGVDIALDLPHRKLWMRNRGGLWNNGAIGAQNPATNTGGMALPTNLATGPVFICVSAFSSGAPDTITVNFGASAFIDTPPAGFGNLS